MSMVGYYLKLLNYYLFRGRYPQPWGDDSAVAMPGAVVGKRVIFMCDGYKSHGGLSDRMRSILTAWYEAKTRKLPFYICWTEPFELTEYLVPSGVCDWRVSPAEICRNYRRSFPLFLGVSSVRIKNTIKKYIFRHALRDKRDILLYSNMMYVERNLPQLYGELFRPSERLRAEVDARLAEIGAPYWSFTFRFGNFFGDFADIVGRPADEAERSRLLRKSLDELKRMLECLPEGFRALVTSDSLFFLERAQEVDDRVYVVKEKLMHVDFYKFEQTEVRKEIWMKSFVDQNMIMKAEKVFLMRTEDMYPSGFPMFAAVIGGREFVRHEF